MTEKTALLLGASGSVGFEVLQVLLERAAYHKIVIYVRTPLDPRKLNGADKLTQILVPEMTPPALAKAVGESLASLTKDHPAAEIMGFSALGVGANTAKLTIDQHRAIDVELNRAFAEALQASSQVRYFGLLSAIGANPKAKTTGSGAAGMARYARVKGEAEEAVKKYGPKNVSVFRPAMIRGSQHTPGILEMAAPIFDVMIPKKYHSISTRQLALAMVGASLLNEKPLEIYTYSEMRELINANLKPSGCRSQSPKNSSTSR